eukprot:28408-Amorphochlora_amoeboformis.AAC.1
MLPSSPERSPTATIGRKPPVPILGVLRDAESSETPVLAWGIWRGALDCPSGLQLASIFACLCPPLTSRIGTPWCPRDHPCDDL